jgi:hypothetical protein
MPKRVHVVGFSSPVVQRGPLAHTFCILSFPACFPICGGRGNPPPPRPPLYSFLVVSRAAPSFLARVSLIRPLSQAAVSFCRRSRIRFCFASGALAFLQLLTGDLGHDASLRGRSPRTPPRGCAALLEANLPPSFAFVRGLLLAVLCHSLLLSSLPLTRNLFLFEVFFFPLLFSFVSASSLPTLHCHAHTHTHTTPAHHTRTPPRTPSRACASALCAQHFRSGPWPERLSITRATSSTCSQCRRAAAPSMLPTRLFFVLYCHLTSVCPPASDGLTGVACGSLRTLYLLFICSLCVCACACAFLFSHSPP